MVKTKIKKHLSNVYGKKDIFQLFDELHNF